MKKCKMCGTMNQDTASKCEFCHNEFSLSEIKGKKKSDVKEVGTKHTVKIVCLVLGVLAICAVPFLLPLFGFSYTILSLFIVIAVYTVLLIGGSIFTILYLKKYRARMRERQEALLAETAAKEESKFENVSDVSQLVFVDAMKYEYKRAQAAYRAPTYSESISAQKAVDVLSSGEVSPSLEIARSLLAAMASRRMIVLFGTDEAEIDGVLQGLVRLTGEEFAFGGADHSVRTSYDLYVDTHTDENGTTSSLPSAFLKGLHQAILKEKSIVPVAFKVGEHEFSGQAFEDLLSFIMSHIGCGSTVVKNVNFKYANCSPDEKVNLAENIRIFLAFVPGQVVSIPHKLMRECAFINLKTVERTDDEEQKVVETLSFARLLKMTEDSESMFYLSEEIWKKIDDLAKFLSDAIGFELDNKLANTMERFISVYMAAGADEQQALDAVLATLVLPGALSGMEEQGKENSLSLSQFVDSRFGLENLPLCAELFKKFSAI